MRQTILPLATWLLFIALLIGFAAWLSKLAQAESMTMRDGAGNSVQLLDEPCFGAPAWLGMRKAKMVYQGKNFDACWRLFGRTVIVLDSAGDAAPIPAQAFKLDVEV